MKQVIVFFLLLTIIFSCNIKRKDRIADDMTAIMEKAAKDTTSVQLIDSVKDFGTVTEGEKVSYNFRFKNIGKNSLVILEKPHASCGCTIAEKPEKPVLPGEIGFIKVVFNSYGKVGHNEKTITVSANTNPDFPELLLKGEVVKNKE